MNACARVLVRVSLRVRACVRVMCVMCCNLAAFTHVRRRQHGIKPTHHNRFQFKNISLVGAHSHTRTQIRASPTSGRPPSPVRGRGPEKRILYFYNPCGGGGATARTCARANTTATKKKEASARNRHFHLAHTHPHSHMHRIRRKPTAYIPKSVMWQIRAHVSRL